MKKVACSMCLFGASIESCSGGTVDRAAGLCPVEDRRGGYRVLGHCWCSGSPEQHVLARCTSRFAGFGSARCMWCPLSKGLLGIPVGEVVAAGGKVPAEDSSRLAPATGTSIHHVVLFTKPLG